MVAHRPMDNPEEVLQRLEEVSRRRPGLATIPRVLDDYLEWVARTGEPFYPWSLVKHLLKEKLAAVVAEYRAAPPGIDVPPCPNVPPFDCDAMRACFLARLDAFPGPPFTIQRICELLAHPRKHYNRVDKFMRAFEKNVLVVGTKEPEAFARFARIEPDAFARAARRDADDADRRLDGCDAASDASVDVEADDVAEWRSPVALNGPADPPPTDRAPSLVEVAPASPPASDSPLSESPPQPDVELEDAPAPAPTPIEPEAETEPEPVDEPAPAPLETDAEEPPPEVAEASSPTLRRTEPERDDSPEPEPQPSEPEANVERPTPQPEAATEPEEPEPEPMDCSEDAPPEEQQTPVVERIDEA